MRLVIVDYGMGNLRSVQRMFHRLGANALISALPEDITQADKLILPGVGHFYQGMHQLRVREQLAPLQQKVIEDKTPVLGICLGMQLMAKHSDEGDTEGLGWIDASVKAFEMTDKLRYKVPHIGWNTTESNRESQFWSEVNNTDLFYFVHSYYMQCHQRKDVLASSTYEQSFTCAVERDNIYGTQFHPEKSREAGENLFANFINL